MHSHGESPCFPSCAGRVTRRRPWIPIRRGLVLFVGGMWFNAAWPGTILPFYGMYLIILGPFARVKRSWSLLVGALMISALTFCSRLLIFFALEKDRGRLTTDLSWLAMRSPSGEPLGLSNPRGFAGSMLYWGAHPLLPWLAFVLVGMWVGRTAWQTPRVQIRLVAVGTLMVASGYALATVMTGVGSRRWHWAWSTTLSSPYRQSPIKYDAPLYILTTIGSSIAGVGLVLLLASRYSATKPVTWLARAGTVTLSLYVLHGLLPAIAFRWFLRSPHLGVGWAVLLVSDAGCWPWPSDHSGLVGSASDPWNDFFEVWGRYRPIGDQRSVIGDWARLVRLLPLYRGRRHCFVE